MSQLKLDPIIKMIEEDFGKYVLTMKTLGFQIIQLHILKFILNITK